MSPNGHVANCEVINMRPKHLFEYLAKQRGISVPELRKLISIRIESGIFSDNPLEKVSGSEFHIRDKYQLQMNGCNM